MTTTHVKSAVTGDFVVVPMAHEPEGDSKNPILPDGIDALGFDVKAFLLAAEWNADEGSTVVHHPVGKGAPRKVLFVGLGPAARVGEETWRRAGGHASRMLGGKEATTAVIGDGVGPTAGGVRRRSPKAGISRVIASTFRSAERRLARIIPRRGR